MLVCMWYIVGYWCVCVYFLFCDVMIFDCFLLFCNVCMMYELLLFVFIMVFQLIVDVCECWVFVYEVLVCGSDGMGVVLILQQIIEDNCYVFDQFCCVKVVELVVWLGIDCYVSINFLFNVVY